MKELIENINWALVFLVSTIIFAISWFILLIIYSIQNEPPQYSADTLRKIKICRTYSNDFWRNDIEFIDGKCYYKGKEVEIK